MPQEGHLDLSNFNKDLEINLTDGELSTLSFDVSDKRWSDKQHGNLGISFGCIVKMPQEERNDSIIGNDSDNKLRGNKGYTLGGLGQDVLTGGMGKDTFEISREMAMQLLRIS